MPSGNVMFLPFRPLNGGPLRGECPEFITSDNSLFFEKMSEGPGCAGLTLDALRNWLPTAPLRCGKRPWPLRWRRPWRRYWPRRCRVGMGILPLPQGRRRSHLWRKYEYGGGRRPALACLERDTAMGEGDVCLVCGGPHPQGMGPGKTACPAPDTPPHSGVGEAAS